MGLGVMPLPMRLRRESATAWRGVPPTMTMDGASAAMARRAGGNKQRAAEIMGIDLSTLYRWQRKQPD